MSETCPLDVCY